MKYGILSWADKVMTVSSEEILTFNNWRASSSYETQQGSGSKSKMPKTTEVSPGIGSISFSIGLNQALGNDVKAEYEWWRQQCNAGTVSLMYLGSQQFGNYKWRIVKVDQDNLICAGDGMWMSCDLSLTFEEYYVVTKKTKEQKQAEKLRKQMEKLAKLAVNAKNEKQREKYAKRAAAMKRKYEAALVEAARKEAEKIKAQKEAEEKTEKLIARYYDETV